MRAPAFPLAATQAWMQAVLVHPEGAESGLSSPDARRHLAPADAARVIRERGGLGAAERLQIYAGMYPLRMVEALRSDYPATAQLLGAREFAGLVEDYVRAFPSRTYTLARLSDRLPDFAAGWGNPRRRGLLADVARLELAATQVFDAGEAAPLDPAALTSVRAADWPRMRLVPAPTLRTLSVRHGAVGVLDAVLEGTRLSRKAGRGRVTVVTYRKDFVVRRRVLGAFEGTLLSSLVSGHTVGAALERAAKTCPKETQSAEALSRWFAEWARLGFFTRIET